MEYCIAHHGVKGMKWGVKNGPPYPLYRQNPETYAAIRRVQNTSKKKKDVDRIVASLSDKDKKLLGVNSNGEYLSVEQGEHVIKRFLMKDGDKPVAFFDVFDEGSRDGKTDVSVALAVAGDEQGKGYGTKIAKRGAAYIDKHMSDYGMVWWTADATNVASQNLAKKTGFKYSDKDSDSKWKIYRKQ